MRTVSVTATSPFRRSVDRCGTLRAAIDCVLLYNCPYRFPPPRLPAIVVRVVSQEQLHNCAQSTTTSAHMAHPIVRASFESAP